MSRCFQLENQQDGLYLNIYSLGDDSRDQLLGDIVSYFDKAKITNCDLVEIKTAIAKFDGNLKTKIGPNAIPNNEFGVYTVSDDRLTVTAVFYPGFVGTEELTSEDIVRELTTMGVKYGINSEEINEFLQTRDYFKPFKVAMGKAPVEGKIGFVTPLFDVNRKAQPRIKEDGTVDYHDMGGLNHVKAGDVVAVLTPEVQGTPGIDVFSNQIIPKVVRRTVFKHGRNFSISEDGLNLISDVSGHVSIEGDKIFVSNVLELVNVDGSTGDIDYNGDVIVTGNVVSGFALKASGNIEVRGIVEGTRVETGGNLVLMKGIQGMMRAVIICGGNMVTKFIESAEKVIVSGNLETDTILHSKVEVKGTIKAVGKNGLIVGGDVRSTKCIIARLIGNAMGTATTVGVGVNPSDKKKMETLKNEIVDLSENKSKLSDIVTALRKRQELYGTLTADKLDFLQKSMRNMIMIEQELTKKKEEYDEISSQLKEDFNARIKVNKTIFSGVKLMFGDTYIYIKDNYDYCQFAKQGSEIKNIPL